MFKNRSTKSDKQAPPPNSMSNSSCWSERKSFCANWIPTSFLLMFIVALIESCAVELSHFVRPHKKRSNLPSNSIHYSLPRDYLVLPIDLTHLIYIRRSYTPNMASIRIIDDVVRLAVSSHERETRRVERNISRCRVSMRIICEIVW